MTGNDKKYNELLDEWRKKKINTVADMDVKLDNFRILFAYNSNAIENPETTYHDTREIFENGKVLSYTGNLRTLFEIQNQKYCYEFLKNRIIEKQPIDSELVRKVHKVLLRGCYDESRFAKGERPGEFKVNDFIVGDNIGTPATETEKEIGELCDEISGYRGEDILTVASYLHLNFESIHPFADGNGRVGRTLMNYFLMIHDYPPAVIYNEDKKTYYMALAVFDKTGEISGFREFLKEETLKTWDRMQKVRRRLESYK